MVASSKPVIKTDLAGQTLVTLRTLTEDNPASLDTYLKLGGYAALKRIVTEKVKPTDIITEIKKIWLTWSWWRRFSYRT